MSKYTGQQSFRHGMEPRLGVLVANLGTPDAPDPASVRRYLAEFLWDPRVIEVPRPIWWLILHLVILRIRPARAGEAYSKVWTEEGSPLLTWSRRQAEGLQARLDDALPGPVTVALGMRYGRPSIESALTELREAGVRRLLVLPMYPQYSATTTATVFDKVTEVLGTWRWLPDFRFLTHYHDEPGYIRSLANSVREHRAAHGPADHLVTSFHGVPRRYLLAGDPYHCECQATARLLAEELALPDDAWSISFQSRVGREEWLRPYTDEHLPGLAREGHGTVDVICPGFSADCLETLEEIAMQNAEAFEEVSGGRLRYIPALNARDDHLEFLTDLVVRNVAGWPETQAGPASDLLASQAKRAAALGGG